MQTTYAAVSGYAAVFFYFLLRSLAAEDRDLKTTLGSAYSLDVKNVQSFPIKKLPAVRQGVSLILYYADSQSCP